MMKTIITGMLILTIAVCRGQDTLCRSREIKATIPYQGKYGEVTITIDCAGNNHKITRPLIIAEGFDVGVILSPESNHGYQGYDYFKETLVASPESEGSGADLRSLIYGSNKQYDIIYVDWHNGVDYLQRNAYALEEVIQWVNSVKKGKEKNVILGQSMGGVVARYALADMEERGINHDTRLFISHDAPQQGANVPVGLQFMYRHLMHQYVRTSSLLLGHFVTIPIIENNFSASKYLSMLDTPASRQLLINFVNWYGGIDNSIHTSFYNELKNKGLPGSGGYPTKSKNIAISDGSECGQTQDFEPGDPLLKYYWNKGLSFWGDLASLIYNPILGTLGGMFVDPSLSSVGFLGAIPGGSRYIIDFQANSISYDKNNLIYKGIISYTKKILWLISVTTNITKVEKYQPPNILPLDSYSGGFYDIGFKSTNPKLFVRDKFCFIPTTSALDIGRNDIALKDDDYLHPYIGGDPPKGTKASPFANFSTEYDVTSNPNKKHISFSVRNGNWLAKEIIGKNIGYTNDCSNFELTGSDKACKNQETTYTLKHLSPDTKVKWEVSKNLEIVDSSDTEITVTGSDKTAYNSFIKATFDGKTLTKSLYLLGKPTVSFDDTSLRDAILAGANPKDYPYVTIRDGNRIHVDTEFPYDNISWKYIAMEAGGYLPYANCQGKTTPFKIPSVIKFPTASMIAKISRYSPTPISHLNRPKNSSVISKKVSLIDYHFIGEKDAIYYPIENYKVRGGIDLMRRQQDMMRDKMNPDLYHMSNTSPEISISGMGLLEVEVTAENKCGCSTNNNVYTTKYKPQPLVVKANNTSSHNFKSPLSIYPSPADKFLKIDVDLPIVADSRTVRRPIRKRGTIYSDDSREHDEYYQGSGSYIIGYADATVYYNHYPKGKFKYTISIYSFVTGKRMCTKELTIGKKYDIHTGHNRFTMKEEDTYMRNFYIVLDPDSYKNEYDDPEIGTLKKTITIDTSVYPNGIYVVKVVSHNENGVATKKIIIKH